MNTVTVRLSDDVANRLKNMAQERGASVNKLLAEITVEALDAHDSETRIKAMTADASIAEALAVLEKLHGQATQE